VGKCQGIVLSIKQLKFEASAAIDMWPFIERTAESIFRMTVSPWHNKEAAKRECGVRKSISTYAYMYMLRILM
jgi:hypothetical protein